MRSSAKGQVVILGVVVLLLVLAILVPGIIKYMQNESNWTLKETRTTRAFELAEAAVERGYQQIIQSTVTWSNLQSGTLLAGYQFDQVYTDLAGGRYEIRITSGAVTQKAIVTGVGEDKSTHELRAVKAIYSNSASNAAIYAMGGITLTSNPGVEWGPVMSPNAITTNQAHPRFYSAGNVSLDPNGPAPPNTDNIQWWSYVPNLPPAPQIDLQAYLASATAQGHYYASGGNFSLGNVTGTYYINGDATFNPSNFLAGDLIVIGNFTLQGNAANGSYNATVPAAAWKEYGNDWSNYRATYDPSAPGAFPGINGSCASCAPPAYALNKVVVHGFMYVGQSFSITGGGNCCVHGSLYVGNASSLDGSHVKVYYDDTITMKTKNVSLGRASWQEINGCDWSGTNPTCP